MNRPTAAVAVVAIASVGIAHQLTRQVSASAVERREWPITRDESVRLDGLRALERELVAQVAPVCSGIAPDDLLRAVAPRLRALQDADETLAAEARTRCGVAVVTSGGFWVPRR